MYKNGTTTQVYVRPELRFNIFFISFLFGPFWLVCVSLCSTEGDYFQCQSEAERMKEFL